MEIVKKVLRNLCAAAMSFLLANGLCYGSDTLCKVSGSAITHNLSYAYDMRSQLTDANQSNIDSSTWSADFTYLKNGNMDSRTINSTTNYLTYNGDQMLDDGGPPLELNGLVGHWKMDDNDLNTTVDDSKGTNHGTALQYTNNLHTEGKVDGALSFNGTSDRVSLSPIPALQGSSITIAAWVYLDSCEVICL